MSTVMVPATAGTVDAEHARPAPAGRGPVRLVGLDRLRGLALLCMLVHHVLEWTTGRARDLLPGWPQYAVTDTAAPAFAVAAGASAYLLVRARRLAGGSPASTARVVVRRYGVLVPIGMAMGLVAFEDVRVMGVLGILGLATLSTVAVGSALSAPVAAALASTLLLTGGVVERWANDMPAGSAVRSIAGGTFPVTTYLGFVLVGWCAAPWLRRGDRPAAAALVGVALAVGAAVLAVAGHGPDRYPSGPSFAVPGLAGTFLAYAAVAWPRRSLGTVDTVVRRAARHTLGIFVTHYAVFVVLDRTGTAGTFPTWAGVAAAVAVTVVFVLAAPAAARVVHGGRRQPAVTATSDSTASTAPSVAVPSATTPATRSAARR